MGVRKITVCHKRNDCIGCGSCVLYAPKQWFMNQEDGKSDLLGAEWKGDQFKVSKIDESDLDNNKKAAAACPVGIIRVD
ncbi:MAG: ferredoxin [Candidatus Moranbacteria bacterium]|nr:ferredoxin [Candidatus Moranbacteria bacterium]